MKISIVLSDRNWILERLGRELEARLDGITLVDNADPLADLNYYITFACRKEPMPTLEAGLFTHMEQAEHLQQLFLKTARELDLSICMSQKYVDLMKQHGIKNAKLISPGVDLDKFQVKLRVGVVGRAYHTGRKGEGVVSALMDMESIDWHFTGAGWPKPGTFIADEDLPSFYRSLDYVLVPALYEGGPMCVPEALAVGTPVIASDVGWVSQFPHIPFKTGDAEDLRRVLEALLTKKRELRESTLDYTWDAYAAAHDRAFRDLSRQSGNSFVANLAQRVLPKSKVSAQNLPPIRLLLHGNEQTTKGGPGLRVPRTAETLQSAGFQANASTFNARSKAEDFPEDLVHLFNVWSPDTAMRALIQLKSAGKRVAFSPIYLDLSELPYWQSVLPNLDLTNMEAIAETSERWKEHLQAGRGRLAEAVPGYNAMIEKMISLADHTILLSNAERMALSKIGVALEESRTSLVLNPVDAEQWSDGKPELFHDAFLKGYSGPKDYVVCVGRIESRKNQMLLARALRDMDLTLVLVGHAGDQNYLARVREAAGTHLIETGRLEAGSEMMRSVIKGASVFALPSWSEGASLAALEAAAAGSNMVLSDRSSETEYFKNMAEYCEPGDPRSIKSAIERALSRSDREQNGHQLRSHVVENHSWYKYGEATAKAYEKTIRGTIKPFRSLETVRFKRKASQRRIVLDVTTLAHHNGRVTGISRVEQELARNLSMISDGCQLVFWQDTLGRFLEMPPQFARFGAAARYRSRFDRKFDTPQIQLDPESCIIMGGSAWMQNERYVRGLEHLKTGNDAILLSIIYDLVPIKFPQWFDSDYSPVFQRNFERLLEISDGFFTDSESCSIDLKEIGSVTRVGMPEPCVLRLGDPVLATEVSSSNLSLDNTGLDLETKKFVLAVGAVHTRKNYEMLYRVWSRFADDGTHGDLHLIIVGGVAWNGQTLVDTIKRDPRVANRIHILNDIDDHLLSRLYERCLFTVFPSHYEGWGLPVAESLIFGKLCLATSSSAVPEIAPNLVEHIDPEDFTTWHHKIGFFASSKSAREQKEQLIRSTYEPVPWSQTAEQISAQANKEHTVVPLNPILPGRPALAAVDAPALSLSFDDCWHPPERFGRWSRMAKSKVEFEVDRIDISKRAYSLIVSLKFYTLDEGSKPFKMQLNGKTVYEDAAVSRGSFESIIIDLPSDLVLVDIRNVLEFEFEPSREANSKEPRILGIGFVSMTIASPELNNVLTVLTKPEAWSADDFEANFALSDHRDLLARDFAYGSGWGVGSPIGQLRIQLPILTDNWIEPHLHSDRVLEIELRPVASVEYPTSITAKINGVVQASQLFSDSMPQELLVPLPTDTARTSAPIMLTIETSGGMTPEDLNLSKIGHGPNIVGFGVFRIALRHSHSTASITKAVS